ncbi:hypothetical protein GCM10011487_61840 [Steroidobacter agaridevorans]|uniref:Uncharacterized protein n=1 Tax=Steroidobacter agaridevorans TaxID=2695856 RepID=A0A829YL84_9GAMM|nr:hypothetical protein GCM10011487_61840 [Steroidobacter agaridevorans]GFE87007.1 hypothetical protein GCM10011488_19610 [Steroidobacter agaridevorans]
MLAQAGDQANPASSLYQSISKLVRLAGADYALQGIHFGLDARFSQVWNLSNVTVGDLATTLALAPQEQLTIELVTSQRKVLDQTALDSTESLTTAESTTSDKEAVNVARSASKTEGWHVDGTASVSVGYASASISAGYSKSITDSNQQTINHVSEATKKSAKNLKTLHSVSVRGVSESFVQSRMTRVLRNPYADRTMAVNVFQLLKHYSVATDLVDQRGAFIVRIESINFDAEFVLNHISFLQETLLDSAMVDSLPSAVQGAKPLVRSGALGTAVSMSTVALDYLFNLTGGVPLPPSNILNLQVDPNSVSDQNDPAQSFTTQTASPAGNETSGLSVGDIVLGVLTGGMSLTAEAALSAYEEFKKNELKMRWSSGFDTAVRTKASALFMTLAYFNAIVRTSIPDTSQPGSPMAPILTIGNNAILIANALATDLAEQWNKLYPDPIKSDELHAMMSSRNYTEVFRRVPGFLAMIRQIVKPLVEPAGEDAAAIAAHNQDIFNLNRLLGHLASYSDFYTSRFLAYVSRITNGESVAQFARGILQQTVFAFNFNPEEFDPDRAFVSARDVVIPGFGLLTAQDLLVIGRALGVNAPPAVVNPVKTVDNIEVPADGTHLEAVAGMCVLAGVPPQPTLAGTVNAAFGRQVL